MNFIRQWKTPLLLWFASVALFISASATGYVKGSETIRHIAIQFHQNRVQTMLANHRYHNAAKEYIAWSWLEPQNQSLIEQLAEIHLLGSEPHRAFYRIAPLAETMTADSFTLCRLMTLIQADRNDPSALEWANRTQAAANPAQQAESTLIVAHVQRRMNKRNEAIANYTRVLNIEPDHPEALYYRERLTNQTTDLEAIQKISKQTHENIDDFSCTPEFILKHRQLKIQSAR